MLIHFPSIAVMAFMAIVGFLLLQASRRQDGQSWIQQMLRWTGYGLIVMPLALVLLEIVTYMEELKHQRTH